MAGNKPLRLYNLKVNQNTIILKNLEQQRLIPEFIQTIRLLVGKLNFQEINIDFENVERVYPYPAVPIAGYIHLLRTEHGIKFNFLNTPSYVKNIHFNSPENVLKAKKRFNYLDKVWIFNDDTDVHTLLEGISKSIRTSIVCEKGVLDACTWGLSEIMDNVIQHSEVGTGLIMAQVHHENPQLKVCIFDYGIGIMESLRSSDEYNPKNATDALTLAIKKGVTRGTGLGNGLWGLYSIIEESNGELLLISGKGGLKFKQYKKHVENYKSIITLNKKRQATAVYFAISLEETIAFSKAVGGYEMINLFIESLENEYDELEYKIAEHATGTGTRVSGKKIRLEVCNLHVESQKPIKIDFDGVGIVASSFADELIGKLIDELGFMQFQNVFRIRNMNKKIESIVQTVTIQRLKKK